MSNEEELILRINGDSAEGQKAVQQMADALKSLGGTSHEAGDEGSFMGGILNEVFGSFPAKVAEGVLLRDAIHEIIATIKEGAIEFGIMGSEIDDVHKGFDRLAGGTATATDILDAMRKGVVGTINDFKLMTAANKLLATGALTNAKDFGTLTEASRVLSREGFGPTQTLIEGLSNAMETGRTKRLALMGVTVDAKGEEAKYAASLGLTSSELTTAGKLHADRIAIMNALTGVVHAAGEQETSLAEKIFAGKVAVENWTHSLAEAIAVSPQVNAAFDSISEALVKAFGGDAQHMLDSVVGWVNRFADGVREYGPPIIQALVDTKDKIVDIWHTVERAWDLVPDWFKNIARDAGIAGVAVFGVKEALAAMGGGSDIIGSLANVAQIWSVIGVNIGKASTAIKEWTLLVAAFKWEAVTLAFSSIGTAIAAIAATPAGVAALLAALAAALWETGKAFKALYDTIESGKSVWDFLTARDEDTFVRRWLGMSTGVKGVTVELNDQRTSLEALMHSHGAATESTGTFGKANEDAVQGVHKLSDAEKAFAKSQADIDSAGSSWVDTLNQMNPAVVAYGLSLLKAGVSLENVKINQGLTEVQGKALENQFKFLTTAATDTNKAFDVHNRIMGLMRPTFSDAHEYLTGLTNDQKALSATVYDFGITKAPVSIDAMGRMEMTTEGLRDALKKLRNDGSTALDAMVTGFQQLTKGVHGSSNQIISDIGLILNALQSVQHSGQKKDASGNWVDMSQDEQDQSTKSKAATGALSGFAMGMGADTSQGFNHSMITGMGLDAAHLGTTIALGVATLGISVGVSAVTSALKYLFRDRTMEDIARDAGNDFGTKFSDATTKSIKAGIDAGLSFPAAELANLAGIIKDAGGLNDGNMTQMTARLHDVYSMIETHQLTVAQGAAVIDQNWQAFVQAGTDGDGRLAESLKTIIKLNDQFGTQSKEIAKYLQQQGSDAITGFNAVVAGTKDAVAGYDALKKAVDDAAKARLDALHSGAADDTMSRGTAQGGLFGKLDDSLTQALKDQRAAAAGAKQSLSDLGVQAVASFAAAVAAGTPMATALKAISPALTTLRQSYIDLGLNVDDVALKNLMMQNAIVSGNPDLMNAIGGLSQEMVALDNMSLLNVDSFGAMERTGFEMYTRLQAAAAATGGTTKDALIPMQDYLHKAADEAKALGIPLDANTQMLIDQSKDLSIWKDKGKDANGVLLEGVGKLVDKMNELIDSISGKNGVTDAIAKIGHTTSDQIPKNPFADWKVPPIDFPAPPEYGGPQALGGDYHVTRPTWFLAGEKPGGEDISFSGVGKRFGQSAGPSSGPQIPNLIVVHAKSADPDDIYDALPDKIKHNYRGLKTKLRQAVAT